MFLAGIPCSVSTSYFPVRRLLNKTLTHVCVTDVLDSQAMPIPAEVEEERKIVAKPPVPEKPAGLPAITHTKEHSERLQAFVVDIVGLIKRSEPPLPASHPLQVKCAEIEAYFASLGAGDLARSSLPEKPPKPALPPKTVTATVKKAPDEDGDDGEKKSGRSVRRRAPRANENALPSVVLKELTTHIGAGGFRGNRRGFPRGRGGSPVSPRGGTLGPIPPPRSSVSNPDISVGKPAQVDGQTPPETPPKVRVRRRPSGATLDARATIVSLPHARSTPPILPPRSPPSGTSAESVTQSNSASPAIPAKPRRLEALDIAGDSLQRSQTVAMCAFPASFVHS